MHLKLGLQCLTCHAKAAASTQVTDKLMPDQAVCLRCHKTARIKKPFPTPLNRFNHQLHLKLGNVAPVLAAAIDSKTYLSPPDDIRRWLNTKNPCAACHRGLEESDHVSRAALPQMADCLVCHSQVDPPESCKFCHGPEVKLTPPSHTADWLDRHSSGKVKLDKQSCAVCHGRNFTCEGCH